MIFRYPYSDMYTLNLDWMVNAIKEVQEVIGELGEVVNSVNEMTGDVVLTKQFVLDLLGSAVEKFNGRSGEVTLTAADVNATAIDITYVSDPGETISDFTSAELAEMYESGKRLMIMLNNLGVPDQLYCLVPVGNAIEAQAYTPTAAEAGVVSVNGASGALTITGDNLPIETGETATIADAVTNLGVNLATESNTRVGAENAIMDNLKAGVCPVITSATVNNSGVDIASGDYFVAGINNVPTLVQANAAILQDANYTSSYDAVPGNGGLNALNANLNRFIGGLTNNITIPANSNFTSDVIPFGRTFANTPAVVANITGSFNANEVSHVIIYEISVSGFKFRVKNLYNSELIIKVSWMAYNYT